MMERKKKILIVDDDPAQLRLMARMLANEEHEILEASNGKEAMRIVATEEPRIVITDWMMPEMDGVELCRALRQHEGIRFVYVIIVTSHTESERVTQAFEAGADDFLSKPIRRAELLARLHAGDHITRLESDLAKRTREMHRINAEMALAHQQLNRANEQLKKMATTDELTGLLNRREAMNRLHEQWSAYHRYQQGFSCIMLDIDHFKKFNDTHGHAAGDRILKEMAQLLQKNTRRTDVVCRIGGEEFLILCPNAEGDGAVVCAEHLRAAVEQHCFEYEGTKMRVTISLGVAPAISAMADPEAVLKNADALMYASKQAGRNRVSVADVTSEVQTV